MGVYQLLCLHGDILTQRREGAKKRKEYLAEIILLQESCAIAPLFDLCMNRQSRADVSPACVGEADASLALARSRGRRDACPALPLI
jgi:hypothetical protein